MKIKVRNVKIISLPKIKDGRDGILCVAEQNKNIPFDIKRIFFIYKLNHNDAIRGKHAHKKVEQVIFCIHGKLKILVDDGTNQQTIELKAPEKGLYIGTYVWNVLFDFSDDCIILVLASDYFDEQEYIRDYKIFLKEKAAQ